jgi:4'-phosphopantetheinyl transferase
VGIDPRELIFAARAGGKPFLAAPAHSTDLHFNLSHSHELALLAVSRGREVGVDLEWLSAVRDTDGIAARYFSPVERQALERLAPDQRRAAFLRGWVLKEAYLKACGDGLTRRLTDFDVAIDDGAQAAVLEVRDRPGDEARWMLQYLHPHREFVAALVVEGTGWGLECWGWGG